MVGESGGKKQIDEDFFNENFNYCSIEALEFILKQGQMKLDATVEIYKTVTLKIEKVIKYILPSIIALSLFIADNAAEKSDSWLVFPATLSLVILFISLFILWSVYKSYEIYDGGVDPLAYMNDFFFDKKEIKSDELYKNLILSQIYDIQKDIVHNRTQNQRRVKRVDFAWKILVLLPFTLLSGINP